MRPLKLSAVALAAGLAIAGCGGADEQAADTSTPVVNPPTSGSPTPAPSPTPTPSPSPTPTPSPSPTPTPSPSPTPTPPPPPPPTAALPDACETNKTTRRLSKLQYINALSEFVRSMTNDSTLAATVPSVVENTAQLASDLPIDPEFPKHLGLTRLDQSIGQARGTAIYTVSQNLATSMTNSTNRLNAILGQCNAGVDACLNGFIQKAGRLLYRKPLAAAEVTALRNVAGGSTSAASVRKVLAAMMSSPQMYLMVERAAATAKICSPLTGPELASRLALHLWDSIPDDQLNAAADKPATDSTSLLNDTGYAAQVTRMVNDARADASMRSFFRQWFRLDELLVAPLNGSVGTPKFDAFAGSFRANADTTNNAINEVLDMVSFLGANNGTLQQIFTNKQSFARTDDIATLYKTNKWDGKSTPPTFTEPEREGLFGRIAFVANGSTDTTLPIQRSVKILGALACQDLGLPAIDQSPPAGAVLTGVLSTRTITERITEQDGTVCRACHTPDINPWGFALEKFDALGRVRAKEVVRDATGKELGQLDLNTTTTVRLRGVAPRAISSLAEAQKYLLDSGQMESCFARTYVRYTFGRNTTAADQPLINSISLQAKAGLKLRDLFAQVALRPEFKTVKGTAQ